MVAGFALAILIGTRTGSLARSHDRHRLAIPVEQGPGRRRQFIQFHEEVGRFLPVFVTTSAAHPAPVLGRQLAGALLA